MNYDEPGVTYNQRGVHYDGTRDPVVYGRGSSDEPADDPRQNTQDEERTNE